MTILAGYVHVAALAIRGQRVGPAVRGFVNAYPREFEVIPVRVAVRFIEHIECSAGKMFGRRRRLKDDGAMIREGGEEREHRGIGAAHQEGVVPRVDQFALRDCPHLGEIHDHALARVASCFDHVAGEGDFKRVAMAVKMAARAQIIGNTMAGVELQPSGDAHGLARIGSDEL